MTGTAVLLNRYVAPSGPCDVTRAVLRLFPVGDGVVMDGSSKNGIDT